MADARLTDLPEEILLHVFSYLYKPWHLEVRTSSIANDTDIFTIALSKRIDLAPSLASKSVCKLVRDAVQSAYTKTLDVGTRSLRKKNPSFLVRHKARLLQVETVQFPSVSALSWMGKTLLENMPCVRRLIVGPVTGLPRTLYSVINSRTRGRENQGMELNASDDIDLSKHQWTCPLMLDLWYSHFIQDRGIEVVQKLGRYQLLKSTRSSEQDILALFVGVS